MDKGAPLGVGIAWVLLMGGIILKGCHDDNDDLCEAACYPHKVVQCDVYHLGALILFGCLAILEIFVMCREKKIYNNTRIDKDQNEKSSTDSTN